MVRLCQTVTLWAAIAAALCGCSATEVAPDVEVSTGPSHVEASDLDGALTALLPADLVVHAHRGAMEATAPDGSFRAFIGLEAVEPLMTLAGPAKDALTSLGWVVDGEQHFEQAIFIALRRGGTRDAPKERRQIWWVNRGGRTFVCDAIAQAGAFRRLGTPHRALCQGVVAGGADGRADGPVVPPGP
jgi:hypothetical protein